MEIEQIIQIIERETTDYIQQEKKNRLQWTSDDFKLVNKLKHRLIMKIEEGEKES